MPRVFSSFFPFYFVYRLTSVLVVKTSFVPDEYWQSLEVAHNMVFGYGYITWEWQYGLRSYLFPFIIACFYEALKQLNLDDPVVLIILPKVAQAFLTAISDRCFELLCKDLRYDVYWARTVVLTNWFWYYCGFRTLSNTFETSLTIIALYYYPWNILIKEKIKILFFDLDVKPKTIVYMSVAAISCLIRPTSALIWGPLIFFQMFSLTYKYNYLIIMKCGIPILFTIIPIALIIDYMNYRKFVFPPYNFFMFNIHKGISSFYGTQPFEWYITQALPVVLGAHFLPFVVGVFLFSKKLAFKENCLYRRVYGIWLFLMGINLAVFSNIPHKEFRFVLPLQPIMMLMVVATLSNFVVTTRYKFKVPWTAVLLVGFLAPTLFFGIFHQSGTLKVMDHLRSKIDKCHPNCYFLFLMPCHSTPLYSHLHHNVTTKFLTCDPPLGKNTYDEANAFSKNPKEWLNKNWNMKPSHVVFFNSTDTAIQDFLILKGYVKKNEFFHTYFPEKNTGNFIYVFEPKEIKDSTKKP